jgi:ElaB/YqjD/DUF883 family membrane-anchored ribosome-binding protein
MGDDVNQDDGISILDSGSQSSSRITASRSLTSAAVRAAVVMWVLLERSSRHVHASTMLDSTASIAPITLRCVLHAAVYPNRSPPASSSWESFAGKVENFPAVADRRCNSSRAERLWRTHRASLRNRLDVLMAQLLRCGQTEVVMATKTEAAVEAIKERFAPAFDRVDDALRQGRQVFVRRQHAAEDAAAAAALGIRRRPLSAVTMAAGAGALVGGLVGFGLGCLARWRK